MNPGAALHRLIYGFRITQLLAVLARLGIPDRLAAGARSDAAGSLRDVAALYGEPWLWQAYGNLLHSVRTGGSAFEHVHGDRSTNTCSVT